MKRHFFLDASALLKRYVTEAGSTLVNHLFGNAASDQLACLLLGVLEVISVIVRKKNRGDITVAEYQLAIAHLRQEILVTLAHRTLSTPDEVLHAAIPLIDLHSINANDAVFLSVIRELTTQLPADDQITLIASDQRLLKAAQAEGLATFNPETQSQAELDALLNS